MQGPDFLFAFRDSNYNFWKIDSNYNVFKNSAPYFIDFAPSGWEDIAVNNKRNDRYWGIDRNVTVPLTYVLDGADILKHIFYTIGTEEPVYLVICSQQLDYKPVPSATISVTTGGLPFTVGSNSGTVTGVPGETVYINFNTTLGISDALFGTINAGALSYSININNYTGNTTYAVIVPDTGVINYFVSFFGGVGASSTIGISNQTGGNTATYKYWYKQIFCSQIDFTTFDHDGPKVTCQALEAGMAKYLKSNENTTIEIPMAVDEVKWVKLDGIQLHEKSIYQPIPDLDMDTGNDLWIAPVAFIANEGDHTGILLDSQSLEKRGTTSFSDFINTNNKLIKNVSATPNATVRFQGLLETNCTERTADAATVRFSFLRSDLTEFQLSLPGNPTGLIIMNPGQTRQIPFDITIPIIPGQQVLLCLFSQLTGTNFKFHFTTNSNFTATYITRYPATYIRSFTGQYLFTKLINFITDGKYAAAISQYLEANKNVLFTCGNAIRGLQDAALKTNWSDFFQWWDSFDSVGISEIQHLVNIDRKKNLIDENSIIQLPSPKEGTFKVKFSKKFPFNELAIGYPEIKNEIGVINGNQEFNDGMLFSIGTVLSPAKLDKTAKYKASPYEIEKLRTATLDKDTTDYKADNDVFLLAVEDHEQAPELFPGVDIPTPYFLLDRSLNPGTTGLIEPDTVFNLPLTPHRNLRRNGDYIRSAQHLADSKVFAFMSADKNSNVVSGGLAENQSENVGGLGNRFFYPVEVDAEFDSPENLLDLLDINPLQVFEFPMPGFTVRGIMQDSGVAPSNRKSQQYQFLLSVNNDLNKIKQYNGS